jgi:predicted methyltransferase
VYEGAFRILRALGDGRSLTEQEVVRAAGESASVVREVTERYPKWFEQGDDGLRCSESGLAALARELVARTTTLESETSWSRAYEELAVKRSEPKRGLDQVYVTTDTAVRRAKLLVESGDHQRGLVFLGDDDLTSAAVQLAGAGRQVTVVETDPDILKILDEAAEEHGWELEAIEHDLRNPLPRSMRNRFGSVFTDPPYAIEGFRLFISRAADLLKPDGRLYVCFGHSRRASERGLQKQRVLGDAGFLVEAVFEGFNRYEGAESIGSQSALWRCRVTPETKALVTGKVKGPLYTSRPPKA